MGEEYHSVGARQDRATTWRLMDAIAAAIDRNTAALLVMAQALITKDVPVEDWHTINNNIDQLRREIRQ